jgi:phosphoribosylformylglycinamidine synthase
LEIAKEICKKWDVPLTQIGEVTSDGILHISYKGRKVAEIKAIDLVLGGNAPQYDRLAKEPKYLEETRNFDFAKLNLDEINPKEAFIKVFGSPNIVSKRWVYEQYDHQVRTNTVRITGDAAVLRLKEIPGKGIALSTDCNSRYVYLNPYRGAVIAVVESARNVACVGARPVAITNCLNFGNPYNPEVYWTFKQAVMGMGDACRYLNTPVTGGNVSFHNESQSYAIYPTPTIGMLGIIDDIDKITSLEFKNSGDFIYLVGETKNELGGSEFLKQLFGLVVGDAPTVDLEQEKRLIEFLLEAIQNNLINSAHDCSEGGLAICLAEKAVYSKGLGARINLGNQLSIAQLFSESQGRVVVSLSPEKANEFEFLCEQFSLKYQKLGEVVERTFEIANAFSFEVDELSKIYFNQLEAILG